MKLIKLALVVAVFTTAGIAKADDGVGPRMSLDEYRGGEFMCPRILGDVKKSSVKSIQSDVSGIAADSAN